ncbi:MAG: SWIM zinc finger domain-containing protein [Comamonas sp.]|nr:SWIM zinc finger domain-containing protein [Comamonas sp.]
MQESAGLPCWILHTAAPPLPSLPTLNQASYAYLASSSLTQESGGHRLALATSGGRSASEDLFFFSGFVQHPAVVAQSLLLLARVARTRFYVPPNALAAVLRAADPVVTSTPEGLRFESFSACCGVYARLDVDASALDIAHQSSGVTNVDVNPPLRHALAAMQSSEPLHLKIGTEALQLSTAQAHIVEEKVPLPARWLKGFAETQMLCAGMALRHVLQGPALQQFVQALPRTSATRSVMWATRTARSLRLASSPSPGAVCLAGPERLRVLEPLLRFATALNAYGPETDFGSQPLPSAWVLHMPGARLTLALSPEKARGFSGEGATLSLLAGGDAQQDADFLASLLHFEPRIDTADLAGRALLPEVQVAAALNVLASSGQVGFDLASASYFHRPMPLQQHLLPDQHPRLSDARQLIARAAVTPLAADRYAVQSDQQRYEVLLSDAAPKYRCTCPWFAKYQGTRGPCKHVLAVHIFLDPLQPDGAPQ